MRFGHDQWLVCTLVSSSIINYLYFVIISQTETGVLHLSPDPDGSDHLCGRNAA